MCKCKHFQVSTFKSFNCVQNIVRQAVIAMTELFCFQIDNMCKLNTIINITSACIYSRVYRVSRSTKFSILCFLFGKLLNYHFEAERRGQGVFGFSQRKDETSKLSLSLSINLNVCVSKERRNVPILFNIQNVQHVKCALSISLPLNSIQKSRGTSK